MQYSIKDIAKLSGVSIATVSRVINKKGKYSKATEQKVLEVIRQTGYEINNSAQSLRTNTTYTVGILVPDISNYFFAKVVQQIEEALFEKGYSTIICNTARSTQKEVAYLKILETKSVDAIIVISGAAEHGFMFNTSKNIPYICIDREPQNFSDTIFISSNHYSGGYEATDSLIKNGSNHPVIVLHKNLSTSSKARLEGFCAALKDNNIPFSKNKNILYFKSLAKLPDQLREILNDTPEIDAIFGVNDSIAIKIIEFLTSINKHIPDEIQVIGFDNTPATTLTTPKLSSVEQNTNKIASVAVENIIECINKNGNKGSKILIPTTLVERESTNNVSKN